MRQTSGSASPTSPVDAVLASAEVGGSFGYVRNRGCTAAEVLEKVSMLKSRSMSEIAIADGRHSWTLRKAEPTEGNSFLIFQSR